MDEKPPMKTLLLGQSGLRVSQLCLGTMTFGEDWRWGANRDVSRQIFDRLAEAGGNFLDTANAYTEGASEKFVGELIASDRDARVVATKHSLPDQMGFTGDASIPPAKIGNSRKNMLRSVEDSLKRLGTDHIDLLYLHAWDFTTHPEEVMRALDDLVRAGKVLYAGVSDTPRVDCLARANSGAVARLDAVLGFANRVFLGRTHRRARPRADGPGTGHEHRAVESAGGRRVERKMFAIQPVTAVFRFHLEVWGSPKS